MMAMGLVLATSMVGSASASAEPGEEAFLDTLGDEASPESAASEPLTVNVEPGLFDGETLRGWVQQQAQGVLDRRGPLEDGDRIEVEVGGAPLDYVLTVNAARQGELLASDDESSSCACTTDELLAKVEQRVEEAIDRLEALRLEEERAAAQAELERIEREEAEAEKRRLAALANQAAPEPKPYRPKVLGIAGVVGTGLGAVLLVSGIGMAAVGERPPDDDLEEPLEYRPAGLALLGVGAGILATGVVLLVVDVVRCKKDERRCGKQVRAPERAAGWRRWRMGWR